MALELINIESETLDSAKVRFVCLWSERWTMARALKGGMQYISGFLVNLPPSTYAENANLVVKSVEMKRPGKVAGSPDICNLDVEYGIPAQHELTPTTPLDLFTISVRVCAEAIKLSKGGLKYGPTASPSLKGKPLDEKDLEAHIWSPVSEISCKCERMLYLYPKTIGGLCSCVNQSPLLLIGELNSEAYDPGCVLFVSHGGERKRTSEGFQYATRELIFHARENSWNEIWCEKTGFWEEVVNDAGDPLYPSVDFSPLFVA